MTMPPDAPAPPTRWSPLAIASIVTSVLPLATRCVAYSGLLARWRSCSSITCCRVVIASARRARRTLSR